MKSNGAGAEDGFGSLGIPEMLVRSLSAMGADVPTPVQRAAIPAALTGRDVAVVAATGTGKTLAYLLPVAKRLVDEPPPKVRGRPVDPRRRLRALVLCPTRELAQQVAREAAQLFRGSVLRTTAVYGKSPLAPQRDVVEEGVDLLVGTPGRVRELCELDAISLAFVQQCVLDEADRMLDMGFLPQAKEILSRAPESRQLLFYTATMPRQVETVVEEMLKDPQRVDLVGRERSKVSGTPETRSDLGQHLHDIDDEAKTALTVALIKDGKRRGVMVFCRTRRRAGWVAAALRRHEVKTVLIHGDRSQRQRQEALAAFAAGKADVVVATDVASRGLHVPAARCVINYDVPLLPEEYVHRVGRAGHGGGTAEAFTLRCPSDMERWMHVERAMRVKLVPEKAPAFGAYMRTRDGFAPDSEGEFRPGMRAPMQGARPEAARPGVARQGAPRAGASRSGAPRPASSRPGAPRQDSARTGPARAGSARSGAAPHGGGRFDARRAPTKSKRPAPRPGATRGLVDPTAAESETTGRSLASMIMHAPSAARRNKKRIQKGPAKQKRTANQRGKQRKAPITKGQKPGGGVKRAS
jgi:ATP-dependent RNA helicase RhlE